MVENTSFKKIILLVISLTFITTSIAHATAAFPCSPNCDSDSMKTMKGHHDENTHHQMSPGSSHHEGTNGCEGCETCLNFYHAIFSFINTSDTVIQKSPHTFLTHQFKLKIINHIPAAYQTPPA